MNNKVLGFIQNAKECENSFFWKDILTFFGMTAYVKWVTKNSILPGVWSNINYIAKSLKKNITLKYKLQQH